MNERQRIAIGISVVLATVAIVLFVRGAEEPGLRMVIRATARTSAMCVALAFARIVAREALVVLPVSHAMHFAAILTLAAKTSMSNAHIGATSVGGVAIFALMIATATRPTTTGVTLLWIIFVIGFVIRDMHQVVYPTVMVMLLSAAIVRMVRRRATREPVAGCLHPP